MAKFNRGSVRALAAQTGEEIYACARSGGNSAQKALDKQDELEAMTADWSAEERQAFETMFSEEMLAWNQQQENKAVTDLVEQHNFMNVWGAIIGVSVGIILLLTLILSAG